MTTSEKVVCGLFEQGGRLRQVPLRGLVVIRSVCCSEAAFSGSVTITLNTGCWHDVVLIMIQRQRRIGVLLDSGRCL